MSTDRENQPGNSQAKPGEWPQKAMPLILGTAGHIDHGFSVAKEVYKVLEPVIKEYSGNNHIHGHAMKAISGYENLRNQAMEAHHHVSTVGHKLSGLV